MAKKEKEGDKIKTGISDYLISYDCPSGYVGFPLLCDLLKEGLLNFTDMALNLKSIYLKVAHRHKMTRVAVERNLHTLVEKWVPFPKFKELFDKEPTNADLLHSLARRLRYLNCSVYDTLLMP